MSDWRSFWDGEHSIYVNARHKDVHYREIADQIAAFVPSPSARVLDYGSGDAIHADRVAAVAAEVTLCDAAPSVRAAMAARFASNPRIKGDRAGSGRGTAGRWSRSDRHQLGGAISHRRRTDAAARDVPSAAGRPAAR